jgi:hypothetical protein
MLSHLYTSTVTLKRVSGTDSRNNPVVSETVNMACYIEYKARQIINRWGTQVVSMARIHTNESISPGDLVTLNGKDWEVIFVGEKKDLSGTFSHNEVYV